MVHGLLNIRLFDTRWRESGGVKTLSPLGASDPAVSGFVSGSEEAAPPGFYAIVAHRETRLTAAVDRIRSIPIFYGSHADGRLFLSDRAEWVRQRIGSREIVTNARNDFLLTGYVTGPLTLFRGVRQLEAGQRLDAHVNEDNVEVRVSDHSSFVRKFDHEGDVQSLYAELDSVMQVVVGRLVELTGDRQIAVPLSGGNDSRIIAIYLARQCPERVITFAYGRPSLGEVAVSRAVAESLDLPWYFVEGTDEFWSELRASPSVKEFLSDSHQYSSAPYLQDWPAVRYLRKLGIIEEGAVIVPGHSGDVPTGGMMLQDLLNEDSSVRLEEALRRFHYVLWPYDLLETDEARLEEWIAMTSLPSTWGHKQGGLAAVGAGDSWNWRERQAKWLVNSVRGFEAVGAAWWMPLWDAEFLEFWQRIPLQHLQGRSLYKGFVEHKLEEVAGVQIPNYVRVKSSRERHVSMGRRFVPKRLRGLARGLYKLMTPGAPSFGEMGWERWIEPEWHEVLGPFAANITSFGALETLLAVEQDFAGAVPRRLRERLSRLPSEG